MVKTFKLRVWTHQTSKRRQFSQQLGILNYIFIYIRNICNFFKVWTYRNYINHCKIHFELLVYYQKIRYFYGRIIDLKNGVKLYFTKILSCRYNMFDNDLNDVIVLSNRNKIIIDKRHIYENSFIKTWIIIDINLECIVYGKLTLQVSCSI